MNEEINAKKEEENDAHIFSIYYSAEKNQIHVTHFSSFAIYFISTLLVDEEQNLQEQKKIRLFFLLGSLFFHSSSDLVCLVFAYIFILAKKKYEEIHTST